MGWVAESRHCSASPEETTGRPGGLTVMDVQPRSVWQAVRERVAAHPRRTPKPRTQRRGPRPVALGSVTAHTQVPCPRYAWQWTRGDAAPVPSPTAQRREESQRRLASAAMGSSGLGDLRQTPR